jgi:hypothetical protein
MSRDNASSGADARAPLGRVAATALAFLPGACSGFVQAAVGHPFDTIKTLAQDGALRGQSGAAAGASAAVGTGRRAPSTWAVAARAYESGGVRAFYRGVSVPLAVNTAKRSVQYAAWDVLLRWGLGPFAAGAVTGFIGTVVVGCPAHVVKIRSQIVASENALAALASVLRAKGPAGLFAGLPANVAKDVIFASCYLGLYERYKRVVRPSAVEAAVAASLFVWLVFLPLDTLKTIAQSPNRADRVAELRAGLAELCASDRRVAARCLVAARGVRRAYAGLLPALLRAGPANAASMVVYERVNAWSRARLVRP